MLFKELGLSEPILKSLEELDHSKPSEIQEQAIPIILAGKNIMAAAQTGTGKTGSFVLPMLEMLHEIPLGILKQLGAYAVSMQKVFPKKIIELGIIWTHSAELMKIDVNKALSSIDAI